ncbi:MAG: RidA family protein [Leptospirales bacterium]|nr:RidA family protein [Leptospirales bacterium]
MLQQRLQELGLELPAAARPLASYTPARLHNGLVYVSGQLPLKDGALLASGIAAASARAEDLHPAMAQCFLNALAAAALVVELNQIRGVLRLGAFVASASGFVDQHKVANGASDLAVQIFGESGVHVRAAVGVASLPMNAAVELEVIFLSGQEGGG